MTQVLLSIGHGYSAAATQAALGPDWTVLATSRQAGRAAVTWPQGAAQALAQATHLISWVPPDDVGDPIVPLIADLPAPNLHWVGYASASSVYGDTGGEWIDDHAATAPTTERGEKRLRAETQWQAYAQARGLPCALIRIAGIYGPGRSALDTVRQGRGQRVIVPGQVFNRIHVDDLGAITAAAATQRANGPIIAADAEPAPPQDVMAFAATLLGLPIPPDTPYDAATLSPMARSFYAENKRLRPTRLPELGVTLRHPTYRDGLSAIHAAK